MSKRKDEKYKIIIPNDVFPISENGIECREELIDEELFLYSWLYRHRIPDKWIVKMNIDLIYYTCKYKFSSGSNEARGKRKIKSLLYSLQQKKFIKILEKVEPDQNLKNNEPLSISFPAVDRHIGYNENITYSLFDKFKCPLEFYIYAYIDCFGEEGRDVSYNKWCKLTKKSETTIQEIIEKMNSYKFRPRIWKFSGEYYQNEKLEIRQHQNRYYTRPNDEIKKKWNRFYGEDESKIKITKGFKDNYDENDNPF